MRQEIMLAIFITILFISTVISQENGTITGWKYRLKHVLRIYTKNDISSFEVKFGRAGFGQALKASCLS